MFGLNNDEMTDEEEEQQDEGLSEVLKELCHRKVRFSLLLNANPTWRSGTKKNQS